MKSTPIFGRVLESAMPYQATNPLITISGECNKFKAQFSMDESILSKHLLLIGGTGCGKTNVFYHIIDQLKKKMTQNDVMIVFDTKGDFFSKFFTPGKDCVIANTKQYEKEASLWNIFKEIIADGWEQESLEANISELSWAIFQEAIENNKSQPFFPNAARDLFAAILTYIVRIGKDDLNFKKDFFNNQALKKYLDMMDAQSIKGMLENESDLVSVLSYIGDGTSGQALGVFAELQSVVRKLFTGAFAKDGRFSVRNFVREKQGKTLFGKDYFRPGDHGTCYGSALTLASRQLEGPVSGPVCQPHRLKRLHGGKRSFLSAFPSVHQREHDILKRREVFHEQAVLKDKAHHIAPEGSKLPL